MWRALLLLAVFLGGWAQAKPQVATARGDLYLREGERWVRLTHYAANSEPVVSPDGRWVAYLSTPAFLLSVAPCMDASALESCNIDNLWVLDLVTRQARRVAGQPVTQVDNARLVSRLSPTWSADSRTLSWFECTDCLGHRGQARLWLSTHDLRSAQTRRSDVRASGCSPEGLAVQMPGAEEAQRAPGGLLAECGRAVIFQPDGTFRTFSYPAELAQALREPGPPSIFLGWEGSVVVARMVSWKGDHRLPDVIWRLTPSTGRWRKG